MAELGDILAERCWDPFAHTCMVTRLSAELASVLSFSLAWMHGVAEHVDFLAERRWDFFVFAGIRLPTQAWSYLLWLSSRQARLSLSAGCAATRKRALRG